MESLTKYKEERKERREDVCAKKGKEEELKSVCPIGGGEEGAVYKPWEKWKLKGEGRKKRALKKERSTIRKN